MGFDVTALRSQYDFLFDPVDALLLLCLLAVSMSSPPREIGTLIVVVLKAVGTLACSFPSLVV